LPPSVHWFVVFIAVITSTSFFLFLISPNTTELRINYDEFIEPEGWSKDKPTTTSIPLLSSSSQQEHFDRTYYMDAVAADAADAADDDGDD
jgi:hypothetical protein